MNTGERSGYAAVNVLSTLTLAAACAGVVALAGAPTWGWVATGIIVYFETIEHAADRRARRLNREEAERDAYVRSAVTVAAEERES